VTATLKDDRIAFQVDPLSVTGKEGEATDAN
jgi:hypothetical protein